MNLSDTTKQTIECLREHEEWEEYKSANQQYLYAEFVRNFGEGVNMNVEINVYPDNQDGIWASFSFDLDGETYWLNKWITDRVDLQKFSRDAQQVLVDMINRRNNV
jgi:hypothetical protein